MPDAARAVEEAHDGSLEGVAVEVEGLVRAEAVRAAEAAAKKRGGGQKRGGGGVQQQ